MIKRFPNTDPVVLQSGLDAMIAPFNSTFKTYSLAGLVYLDLPIDPTKAYQINLRKISPNRSANRSTQILLHDVADNQIGCIDQYGEYGGGSGSAVNAYQAPKTGDASQFAVGMATTATVDICSAIFDIGPYGYTWQRSYFYSGKHYGYRGFGHWGPLYQNIDVFRVYAAGYAFVSGYVDIMEVKG